MNKMTLNYTKAYKNAEIVVMVEDDRINEVRVFNAEGNIMDGFDVDGENDKMGVPNTRANIDKVMDIAKERVDEAFAQELALMGITM